MLRAVEFVDVWFRHRGSREYVLKGVNLRIEEGELVAVIGANGAGKTTLIKHLNGLLKPTRGRVVVFGRDTRGESVASLSRLVGIVFQNPHHQLFSETVLDEVMFGLKNFGLENAREVAEEALSDFGLYEARDRPPLTLSGGEKKRLCFASVLAWSPRLVVFDEPTVGQDLENKSRLVELAKNLTERGRTVVVVSHDVEFLWSLRPRVIVLHSGRVLADSSFDEVFMDPGLLEKAGLRQPQLAELSSTLGLKKPFRTADEAASFILRWLDGLPTG